jgi:long-chain acyl-CoA synthetase
MLTTFVPIYLGSQVNFGESIRTVQEDLRELAPSMFLGVPRIWEKLHAAIHIKMHESGPLRRRLFDSALRACTPFAEKAASQRSLGERITYAFYYWLILRALQNFIGLREAKVALTGAASIPPAIIQFFRTLACTPGRGLRPHRIHRHDHRPAPRAGQTGHGRRTHPRRRAPALGTGRTAGSRRHDLLRLLQESRGRRAGSIIDGWLHTGDVVREENGQLRIVDRLKDIMITAGGKNLTPSEIENTMKGSPYIKECIIVAEGRKYVAALIQIDFEMVGKWAEAQHMAFTNFRSLVDHPSVRELIAEQVDRGNAKLAQVSHIRKFHLLTKELDHDDGEVTATMKVRRKSVARSMPT